jgi:hypothetical protein
LFECQRFAFRIERSITNGIVGGCDDGEQIHGWFLL